MTRLDQEVLDAFYNLFADVDPDTSEEIDEIIRSAGIDPDDYAAKINRLAQAALAEQARHQINRARQKYGRERTPQTGDRQTIMEKIKEMLSQLDDQKRQALAYHRNLESASDADLQSLLDDLTYLINPDDPSNMEAE